MIIPPIRWGDILLRSEDRRSVSISEREQYTLMMLLSLSQMNSELFISDYTVPDSEDIHQFLDECMNSLLNETVPPFVAHTMYPINVFCRNFTVTGGTWTKTNADFMTFRHAMLNTNVSFGRMTQHVYLTEGQWKCRVIYAKQTNSGIWYIKLNGSEAIDITTGLNLSGLFNAEFVLDVTLDVPKTEQYEIEIYNQGATTTGGHTGAFQSVHFWQD